MNKNLEPLDYWIYMYYVSVDFRHQYGISVAELQTFLLAKLSSGEERGAKRGEKRLFSQARCLSVYLTVNV